MDTTAEEVLFEVNWVNYLFLCGYNCDSLTCSYRLKYLVDLLENSCSLVFLWNIGGVLILGYAKE